MADPIILAAIVVAITFVLAGVAGPNDRTWRVIARSAPISPFFVATIIALTLPLLIVLRQSDAPATDPVLAIAFVIALSAALAASVAERRRELPARGARLIQLVALAVALLTAAAGSTTIRYSLVGVVLGLMPFVLGAAFFFAIRGMIRRS